MPLRWPFPSLLSVSFGLCRECPWGLSALSVKQRYKAAFKCRFAHFSFPVAFFRNYCLGAGWELLLGDIVPCVLCCIAGCLHLGWVGRRQNTGMCCSPCQKKLSFQDQRGLEWCPELWTRIYLPRILIFSVEFFLNLTSWVVAEGCQKYLKKGAQMLQLSSLRSLCSRYRRTYPSLPYLHTASLLGTYRRTLVRHYTVEKITCLDS